MATIFMPEATGSTRTLLGPKDYIYVNCHFEYKELSKINVHKIKLIRLANVFPFFKQRHNP